MSRIHNNDLPLAAQGHAHGEDGTQQTRNPYDGKTLPRMFADLIGKRIAATHDDSKYLGCLIKYAKADEFQVEVLVQRNFNDPNYNPDIRLRTFGSVVLTMKHQGKNDGIDRFALKRLDSWAWTVGVNDYGDVIRPQDQCPNYGIGIFGVSEETLWSDYGTFVRIADAGPAEAKDNAPRPGERAASERLAVLCGCR